MKMLLIAAGVALLVVAVAWRARDHRQRHATIAAALRSRDPITRTRALREMASSGLRPWAPMLLTRTHEVDGVEAEELVWLIGACQWEPADEPEIVQLRLWAADRFDRRPAVPAPAPLPVDAPVPVIEPVAVETLVVETFVVETLAAAPQVVTAPEVVAPEVVAPVVVAVEPLVAEPARPDIIDEIESIVGARVLNVSFVPLVGAPS